MNLGILIRLWFYVNLTVVMIINSDALWVVVSL